MLTCKLNPDWVTIVKDPKPYEQYIKDLSEHSFALCPEGNGLDCYRMLECLYSGCIPIVRNHSAYSYMNDMPHVVVNEWREINPEFLKNQLKRLSMTEFDMSKIKLSYWKKNQIERTKSFIKRKSMTGLMAGLLAWAIELGVASMFMILRHEETK